MTPAPLTILHVDMDEFFAAVEVRDNPRLQGLPVCVGGGAHQRGVIASASYAARKFGVRSAMPTAKALVLCPDLVLVPPSFERYTRESRTVMEIFRSFTPLVEPLSLDEAFLDVAGCERLFGDGIQIGRAIKQEILRRTGLVASVGVAPTKFLAKLASDLDKPDGFRVIQPEEVRALLDPMPVSAIFGVGPRTAKRLEALGVRTVGELAARPRDEVLARFGASGAWIHELANGVDPRRVNPRREEKSYSIERTFGNDVTNREALLLKLFEFCEELGERLRDRGLRGRTISIKARYGNFQTLTRSFTLDFATNLGPRIYSAARGLLARTPPGPLRLLGVQVSSLEDVRTPLQGDLFGVELARPGTEADTQRLERATASVDKLRKKFGPGTVKPASLLASASAPRPTRLP